MLFALALAAVGVVAAARWDTDARARTEPAPAIPEADGTDRGPNELASAATVERARVPLPSAEPGATGLPDPSVRAAPARHPAGRLRIRAFDWETGEPVANVRVRAVSDARIAERNAGVDLGDVELRLTPARYALLVRANGYEAAELAAEVAPGADDAERVELRAGSARIDGSVLGAIVFDEPLLVEVLGEGRGPCPRCVDDPQSEEGDVARVRSKWWRLDPCRACGFMRGSTLARVRADGTFTIERLASGNYALRVVDGARRAAGSPVQVALKEGESRSLDLDVVARRSVELELLDTDGSSLAAEWALRMRAHRVGEDDDLVVSEVEGVSTIAWECAFREATSLVARAALHVPPRAGSTAMGMSIGVGSARGNRGDVDDRQRSEQDLARPEPDVPGFDVVEVACEIGADGIARFERVPAAALTLELRCATFRARASIPASAHTARVVARVEAPPEPEPATESGSVRAAWLDHWVSRPPTFRAHEAARYR